MAINKKVIPIQWRASHPLSAVVFSLLTNCVGGVPRSRGFHSPLQENHFEKA
jgi:hypothetical protein